jgi:hypothetical protein
MKWYKNIKVLTGKRILNNQLRAMKRTPMVCTLKEAESIGIIYNATEYVSFEIIRNLVKELTHESKKVMVLGYVDSKDLIDNYLYRKGFDFFSKNELNWYYKPISPLVDQFIQEPFDLLINLSLEDHYPIRYITSLSAARFKTGRYTPDDLCLDLMIDIEKEKNTMQALHKEILNEHAYKTGDVEVEADVDKKSETEIQLNFLINQIIHYLSLLKQ